MLAVTFAYKTAGTNHLTEPINTDAVEKATSSKRVNRPWGSYEVLLTGPGYQVKRLSVKPQQRLSLQWHRHRDEQWVVARGAARVTVGEEEHTLGRGQSMFVARTIVHRIQNISSLEPLDIIEVQTGDYLGEDDIVRVEDDYGRTGAS